MDSPGTHHGGRTILIADDDSVTRTLLSQSFKNAGFNIVTATDGVEACTIAQEGKPDAALVDLLLPRRDGYSVLLYLRSREGTRKLPIVILSGESSKEHPEIARALGAQAYLTKPFDPHGILTAVRNILSKSEGREA